MSKIVPVYLILLKQWSIFDSYMLIVLRIREIDYHQKLIVKFQIKDKQSGEFIRAQQCFLRFNNKKSDREVIYVAEATGGANLQYKVEVVRETRWTDW